MTALTLSNIEATVRALWLVDLPLVDLRCEGADWDVATKIVLDTLDFRDEATAAETVRRVQNSGPPLLDNLTLLCQLLFRHRHGVPRLAATTLARRLSRLVDPDALAPLCEDLSLPAEECFDWPAVGADASSPTANLLEASSLETHIHLGGALPPVFYWLPLMGGELGYDTLEWIRSLRRSHGEVPEWQKAVSRAACLRLGMARLVEMEVRRFEPRVFPNLPAPDDVLWEPFCLEDPEAYLEVRGLFTAREAVLALTRSYRIHRRSAAGWPHWPFVDPLRRAPLSGGRRHYAEGERRLLYHVGRLLRRPGVDVHRRQVLEQALLEYLRVRNAFHRVMAHDRGSSDGLMRFVENFSRRSFLEGKGQRRRGLRRRRHRRNMLALERSRMAAALDSQLVESFTDSSAAFAGRLAVAGQTAGVAGLAGGDRRRLSREPLRRIEMRVSIPGRLMLRTLHSWLLGMGDHLRTAGTSGQRPCSQVGLVFHLIKLGDDDRYEQRSKGEMRRLRHLLEDYPGLRPFIVGLDAAGDERSTPPRRFADCFREGHKLNAGLRSPPGQPLVRLGFTYHVGEDFQDLLTALRHLDEAASLLLPRGEGGRLGHALALGWDAKRFYDSRGGQTAPALGTHLLDLIWALGRMTAEDGGWARWLEVRLLGLLNNPEKGDDPLMDCYRQMALDSPCVNEQGEEVIASEEELLRRLEFQGEAKAPQVVNGDRDWIELVGALQAMLRKRFARMRLCIEANPTSNLIIGGFRDYRQLPYRRLVKDGLALSINTDDPGLFLTSLPGEIAALYEAYAGKMNHRELLSWLWERIEDAEDSTFLGPHVPIGDDTEALTEKALDRYFRYQPEY